MTFNQYKIKISQNKKLNFKKIDNRFYYVYRITNIFDKTHYYGSRVSNKKPEIDFWSYGTSSKQIGRVNHIKECRNEYKLKIIKVFDNNASKILYESYLHDYFDVKNNDKFWNKTNQTPFGFDTTGKISVKNKNNISFLIDSGDERFISGELIGVTKNRPDIVRKRHNTMIEQNLYVKNGQKISAALNKKIIFDGEITTVAKNRGRKTRKTLIEPFLKDGKVTNGYKEQAITHSKTKRRKGKIFDLYKRDEIVMKRVPVVLLRGLTQLITKTAKDIPLGNLECNKKQYINNKKEYLIGLYVLPSEDKNSIFDGNLGELIELIKLI